MFFIYLTSLETGDVIFSKPFNSFTGAKAYMNEFLSTTYTNLKYVTKEELDKIKIEKCPEDLKYARKKDSHATIYIRVTSTGRIYNTYTIEKFARVNIGEIK